MRTNLNLKSTLKSSLLVYLILVGCFLVGCLTLNSGCREFSSNAGEETAPSIGSITQPKEDSGHSQDVDFDFEDPQDQVVPVKLGSTYNVHRYGNLILSGQFKKEDVSLIKAAGIDRIVSLRTSPELDWDESAVVQAVGLEYIEHPFLAPEAMTDDLIEQVCVILRQPSGRTLVHCGGADRVGAIWLVHRVLDHGLSVEEAEKEAEQVGLKTAAYKQKALAYIQDRQKNSPTTEDLDSNGSSTTATSQQDDTPENNPTQDNIRQDTEVDPKGEVDRAPAKREKSVVPGINDDFLNLDLTPEQWVERFEIESREVYGSRMEILKACNIKPGMRIADIGAGTGLFTRLFANQTGPTGWVFAIDISPRLIQHVNQQSVEYNLRNVTAVLCLEDSICLPPESIDLAYICDTYHHFEYPQSTLASIYSALKPGGRMVVIDFIRIEGVSRPWILGHVRAGQEVFTAEIEQAGFQLTRQVEIPGFEENYFLIFTKP